MGSQSLFPDDHTQSHLPIARSLIERRRGAAEGLGAHHRLERIHAAPVQQNATGRPQDHRRRIGVRIPRALQSRPLRRPVLVRRNGPGPLKTLPAIPFQGKGTYYSIT